jgi:hypothetical protein
MMKGNRGTGTAHMGRRTQSGDDGHGSSWRLVLGPTTSWSPERKLLEFAMGTSRIPVKGFKDLHGSDGPRRFTVEKAGDPNQLPRGQTCLIALSYRDHRIRIIKFGTQVDPCCRVRLALHMHLGDIR